MSRRAGIAAILSGVLLVAASLAPSAPPQKTSGLAANAQERIDLAREALQVLDKQYSIGRVSISDPQFALWSRRIAEAHDDLPGHRAERLAAIKAHVERMRTRFEVAKTQRERSVITLVDLNEAKFGLLEAEAWLEKAEAK